MYNIHHLTRNFKNIVVLLCVCFFSSKTVAQSVNITINITPPYSPFYADYSGTNASKVLLTLQNLTNTTKNIKLTGQLEGDNGIRITTKSNYVPLQPIVLGPNQVRQLNGVALKDIFDVNTLNVYGIDKVKMVQTSRLPEGNYTFCIQAVDMSNNQVVSSTAPQGCTLISITYPDSPVLISPQVNTTIPAITGQAFTWLSGSPQVAGIRYTFQVAEMPDVRTDPNQVMNSTSFFTINRQVMNSTSTILMPSDNPLKVGKRYAWRVIAEDISGKIVFKNKGISAANEFRYGEQAFVPSVFVLNSPQANRKFNDLSDLEFDWKFTDNTSKNDNIGFYTGITTVQKLNLGLVTGKYELYITRVKTPEEKKAESQAVRQASIKTTSGALLKSAGQPADGIVIDVNGTTIAYKNEQRLKDYLKDQNSYEWYVKDVASGTVSETRQFAVRYEKIIANYTIALSGGLKYNFRSDYITGSAKQNKLRNDPDAKVEISEAEKGFPLANKSIQVLKVSLLAPKYRVNRKITKVENGIAKTTYEMQDSIALVSDLLIYPYGAQKLSSSVVIASAITDAMGNFKVDVPIAKSNFKILDRDVSVPGRNTAYALIEGLVVRVNDSRFSDPNWFIMPDENKTSLTLEEQTVEIYAYNTQVKLQTSAQRDYKGKLYLLRNNDNVLKGEVQNKVGVTKQVPTYKTMKTAKGTTVVVSSGSTEYTVVGVTDINAGATNTLNSTFTKMAVAGAKNNDGYTVYFEPADEQDALYFNPVYVSNGQGKTSTFASTDFAARNLTEQVAFGPKFISMQISGRYTYQWKNAYGKTNAKLPLPEGANLTLVKGNLTGKDFFKDGTILKDERIISSTTVKKNGEYSFDVGLCDYNDFNSSGGHLVILVQSDYYFSEPYAITYNQNENIKLPELTATVRQYSYISKVGYKDGGKLVPKDGMEVYLCRKLSDEKANAANYFDRPVNVGDPDRNYFKKTIINNGENYEIIDKTTSFDGEGHIGEFTFNRLVVSKNSAEKYYIIAEPSSNSQDNFVTKDAYDLTRDHSMDGIKQGMFTDDQTILTLNFNIGMAHIPLTPLTPYIDGAVYPNSNTNTSVLAGVYVEMFNMAGLAGSATNEQIAAYLVGKSPVDEMITGTNGRFLFENVNAKGTAWKLLRLTKKGFLITYCKVQQGKPLINGQRGNLGKVNMDLPRDLVVKVLNKAGEKVSARIIVGDDFSWEDYDASSLVASLTPKIVQSPLGNVLFTVIPVNRNSYKTTKIYKTIRAFSSSVDLTVDDNQHVINVICKVKGTNQYLPAQVTVLNTANYKQSAKVFGNPYTEVLIPAGGTQFDLKVVPNDVNYTIAKTQVHSDGSSPVSITVEVEPAVKLTITAMQEYMKFVPGGFGGTFQKATEKATGYNVFIKELEEDEYEIINQYGNNLTAAYLLSQSNVRVIGRIPSKLAVNVSLTKKGYIGQTQNCIPWGQNMAKTFTLALAPDMNINSMYGFPIELTAAYEQPNGQYLISGRLDPNVASGNLTSKTKADFLEFKNVYVNVNNAVSGKTKDRYFTLAKPMVFNQNSIDGRMFNKFDVKIIDNAGLSLSAVSNTTAKILGKVALDMASFSKGVETSRSGNEGDKNYLYLNAADASYATLITLAQQKTAPYLSTFSTAGSDLSAASYMVSSSTKEKPAFYGADDIAIVPDGKVTFNNTGIAFAGIISATLEGTAKAISARANYKLTDNSFISSNEEAFVIKLFNWELNVKSWKYGANGFRTSGNLAALGLTIPFSDLQIFSNKIGFGKFTVSSLKLLNAFPVTINGDEAMVSFGYDKGYSKNKAAWSLSILAKTTAKTTYLAGLKGLDDLQPTDVIQIKNINLYDTGDDNDTRLILNETQPAVTLNSIASFRPGTIWGSSSFVKIRGDLNMNIPGFTGLDAVVYDLTYRVNTANQLKHVHETPFTNVGLDTKGMLVKFSNNASDQRFGGGELYLKGVLMDKDPSSTYQIDVELTKTKNGTTMAIPTQINNGAPRVYLDYGITNTQATYANHLTRYSGKISTKESYLDKAVGSSIVQNNQWQNFTFSGNMTGASGIDPSPMSFTIKGDVVANSSKIGVQNMDAGGVNGLSIAYDFKEKALIGSGHIQQNTDFASMDLDIEMKLGSSNWYMFSNGIADVNNTPFKKIGVGFMVGNTDITSTQRASFYKHFDGRGLPLQADKTFGSVKGILFILSAEMPIPLLPTIDLDLDPVAKCEFKHGFYAAAYFKGNFFGDVKETSFTVGGRVGAFVKLSAGASIGLACAGVSLGADLNVDLVGSLAPLQKQFSASAQLNFKLEGIAYVGAGICNSSCETPCWNAGLFDVCSPIPCKKIGLSKTMLITVGATVDNNGFHANQSTSYQ